VNFLQPLLTGLLIFFPSALNSSALAKFTARQSGDLRPLKAGDSALRALAPGESHVYSLTLESGQYFELRVEQRAIGLAVTLRGPDGATLDQPALPNDRYLSVTMSRITKSAGEYRVEIAAENGAAGGGKYELKAETVRAATPRDVDRISANQLLNEARLLGALQKSAEFIPKIIEKYEQSLALWKSLGDAAGEATALGEVAGYYAGPGQAQKALDAHTRALALWHGLGRGKEEAGELSELGLIAYARSESQKAMDYYQQALSILPAVSDPFGEAEALNRLGWLYRSLGEPNRAMEFFGRALPLRREALDSTGESVTLNDLGRVSDELGETQRALDFYAQALALRTPEKDPSGAGNILIRQGAIYDRSGEKQKALDAYARAIELLRKSGDLRAEAAALNNLGAVYGNLNDWERSLDCYERSLKLCREMGIRNGEASVLSHIGSAHAASGQLGKALEYHRQALALQQSLADRPGQAQSLSELGHDFFVAGDSQKAGEYYAQSQSLYRSIGNPQGEATSLSRLGALYRGLGERQKALECLEQALPIHRAVANRHGEAETLLLLSGVWAESGDLSKARASLEEALKIVESQRGNLVSQQLRASFFATAQNYYESYIDVLMQTHARSPAEKNDLVALQASERMRARGLLEILDEARIDIRQGADPSLLDKERALQQRLDARAAAQTRLLTGKHSDAQAAAAAREVAELTSQYLDLQARIRASSPRYAALTEPQPLTAAEIQGQLLDDRTLLLEYALGEKRSYLWAVSRSSVTSYELPPRAVIEGAALKVYGLLTARQSRPEPPGQNDARQRERVVKAEAEAPSQLAALSRMLLAPAASELGDRRLAIVAPGALEYLPFAVLPDPASEGARPGPSRLIDAHEIINLPSASVLAALRRETAGRAAATKSVVALADPVFEPTDPRVSAGVQGAKKAAPAPQRPPAASEAQAAPADVTADFARAVRGFVSATGRGGLLRLPFSRDEAEAILALAPGGSGLAALNFQASRATAASADLGQYRIIHFATHGMLNTDRPELSGLVFSLVDEQGRPQDGFLRLHEIYNMRLSADLVTLSACQTGLGKQVKGEGLVGLTRGFMYAGAPRVVASLWQVNDLATAELMKRFYRGILRDGLSPAAALRAAQLELSRLKQWASPFFWAGFVIQGEWR
jgi:CHAT domain-containing protein/uncharacterized protein HemY